MSTDFNKLKEELDSISIQNTMDKELENVVDEYLDVCHKYVKKNVGHPLTEKDIKYPFDSVVNQINGVKFSRNLDYGYCYIFMYFETGEKYLGIFKKKREYKKSMYSDYWQVSWKNPVSATLMCEVTQKIKERIKYLESEMYNNE